MSLSNFPTCSLIISTYNWPEALEKSIKSAFIQKILPNEIIIADDGSDERTATLIGQFALKSPIPIVHVWHPDRGFRLSAIRNKAIAAAQYDYVIQIDGDIIMDAHFIQDHLTLAHPGVFLCGSRVLLRPELSKKVLMQERLSIFKKDLPIGYLLNSVRAPFLGRLMADRYKRKNLRALRGCNMSFWRKDLLAINGYNNDIVGWGSEDAELALRLINLNIKKRFLKFMGIAYHLYHPENSKANIGKNEFILMQTIASKTTWIENGIEHDNHA